MSTVLCAKYNKELPALDKATVSGTRRTRDFRKSICTSMERLDELSNYFDK